MLFAVAAFALLLGVVPAPSLAQNPARTSDTTYVRLDDLVRTALSQNLNLLSAQAETRATQSYSTAVRSRFDPVLNLGGESGSRGIGGQVTGVLPSGASYLLGSVAPSALPGEPLYPDAIVASISQPVLQGLGFRSVRNSIRSVD
jgi:outer membrane protein TolC